MRMRDLCGFYTDHGLIAVIRHIRHADRQLRARIPRHYVCVILMNYHQRTFQNRIDDFAGRLRLGVNAVSLAGERQISRFLLGFCAIHFIDEVAAQAFNADICDIADVEISVQGAVRLEVTGGFQLNMAGFT